MKSIAPVSLLILVTSFGCKSNTDTAEPVQFSATLTEGASFDDAPPCDIDTQCPDGLDCLYVNIVGGDLGALCLEAETVCDVLDCGDGECLILESYPGQIICSGPPDGWTSNCDSGCTIDNEGNEQCPDDSGDGGGQEPGNPGGE